ncbi:hypothetical protein B0H19DRAFT_1085111 [Mycena capillaripes]|nr:hypothetical protein B0H19DRAFT_1085111 [Mycena capillaripes]
MLTDRPSTVDGRPIHRPVPSRVVRDAASPYRRRTVHWTAGFGAVRRPGRTVTIPTLHPPPVVCAHRQGLNFTWADHTGFPLSIASPITYPCEMYPYPDPLMRCSSRLRFKIPCQPVLDHKLSKDNQGHSARSEHPLSASQYSGFCYAFSEGIRRISHFLRYSLQPKQCVYYFPPPASVIDDASGRCAYQPLPLSIWLCRDNFFDPRNHDSNHRGNVLTSVRDAASTPY